MSEKEEFYARFDSQFEYGYALTVHSSQGSEYGYVVLIDDYKKKNDPEYKHWLYTAITRAKQRIVIIRT
jgi:exodeoxyribonuclease-5